MTVLAVFRSRSQSLDFASKLKLRGVVFRTVNTPKEARVGCGLSVQFDSKFLPQAKFVLSMGFYSSFVGFFGSKQDPYYTGYFPL